MLTLPYLKEKKVDLKLIQYEHLSNDSSVKPLLNFAHSKLLDL